MVAVEGYNDNVFINCPFDAKYKKLFLATVFTVIYCGFVPRCSLEQNDSSEIRIIKIAEIIRNCRYGIHDLSRTELDRKSNLPRFNMPFELGLFMGAKSFGAGEHKKKQCLIIDKEKFRYQKFLSDISGQDIAEHEGNYAFTITAIRNFLSFASNRGTPGGDYIKENFDLFIKKLPSLAKASNLTVDEARNFKEFAVIAKAWAEDNK